jgi:hypothetical protein
MTKIFRILILVVILCLPLSVTNAQSTQQERATVVRIAPQTKTVSVGQVFKVELWVDNVVDLYGADIQLAFTPGAFEVVDADPGSAGVQITVRYDFLNPASVLQRSANNSAGTISYVATQLNPAPPVSGSGVLFEFQFRALYAGTYPITFTTHDLAAQGGVPISHSIQAASYTITGGSATYTNYLPLITK